MLHNLPAWCLWSMHHISGRQIKYDNTYYFHATTPPHPGMIFGQGTFQDFLNGDFKFPHVHIYGINTLFIILKKMLDNIRNIISNK